MSDPQTADIVPFGKYKGRPVVDLIADRDYTDWLAAQPWFRERYATVYNLIVNTGAQPQDTPEHNKMQARFLDHDACLSLLRVWLRDHASHRAAWADERESKLTARQRANLRIADASTAAVDGLQFESYGWDLVVEAHSRVAVSQVDTDFPCECVCDPGRCETKTTRQREEDEDGQFGRYLETPVEITDNPHDWSRCFRYDTRRERHCGQDCRATWKSSDHSYTATTYEAATWNLVDNLVAAVELKPVLGDDYPSVLRDVIKRREMGLARRVLAADRYAVLVDEAQFEGVDLPTVRKIFRTQRVHLLTTAELPAPSPDWQCTCEDCAAP